MGIWPLTVPTSREASRFCDTSAARISLCGHSASTHVATSLQDVIALLESDTLAAVENAIAIHVGERVNRDHLHITASLMQGEISLSGLASDTVAAMLRDRHDSIVAFGVRFLSDDPDDVDEVVEKEGLGVGFGITCAIYLHFLETYTSIELTEFLKKRRIPGARKFAADLRRVHAELTN